MVAPGADPGVRVWRALEKQKKINRRERRGTQRKIYCFVTPVPGLDPGIRPGGPCLRKNVDARIKSGHDGFFLLFLLCAPLRLGVEIPLVAIPAYQ